MQRIFEGLTVLDCASFIAAPAAATILADFGAEVIKIEPPAGDPFRQLPQLPGNPKSEHNWAWMLESRNKQGLALDLSKADGQAVLYRMVPRADVFITNFPPAVRRRLGIISRRSTSGSSTHLSPATARTARRRTSPASTAMPGGRARA